MVSATDLGFLYLYLELAQHEWLHLGSILSHVRLLPLALLQLR